MSLRVEGLSRRFGAFALGELDLEVQAGAYCVLLGPSGCGKSMLLQTITGLHRPDAGRVFIGGREVTALPAERRQVGLVFQGANLFPHHDVLGNVDYGLRVRRVDAAERRRRVDEVVAALGLEAILDRPVASLSGGEAQRVAMARALAIRPALLLLDEPLSLLDHNARLALQAELARLHRSWGLTALHVTHSRAEAEALADRCAIMHGGRILQTGTLDALRRNPATPFVAGFLGADVPRAAG